MNENSVVIKFLQKLKYNPMTNYYGYIDSWRQWFENDVPSFHKYHDQNGIERQIYKLGMAKRVCEDWSSILYTEKDELICNDSYNQEYLNNKLSALKFEDLMPENLENSFWSGTLATIIRVKNAIVKNKELFGDDKTSFDLVNVTADQIVPLRVEHGKIIDVAFVSKTTIENKINYYIEIHKLTNDGYVINNYYIDEQGDEVQKDEIIKEYYTHSNIPLFSLMMPKIVNNIRDKNGLGISVYANAIDQLKTCDITYNNFPRDIELGGKKVFYNKKLVKYDTVQYTDENGEKKHKEVVIYPDDLTKQQFQILGDEFDATNDKELIKEYNPELRVEDNEKAINFALNLLSFKCGLGKGYYRFENGTIVTATQYLGENKDLVGNAKKHRSTLNEYAIGIARSILLLGRLLFDSELDENDTINLTNKDGFLVSDEELLEQYRQDFKDGLMSKKSYLMKARGMSEEQAIKELEEAQADNPKLKDLVGE